MMSSDSYSDLLPMDHETTHLSEYT